VQPIFIVIESFELIRIDRHFEVNATMAAARRKVEAFRTSHGVVTMGTESNCQS
jgi:hypothetical protein